MAQSLYLRVDPEFHNTGSDQRWVNRQSPVCKGQGLLSEGSPCSGSGDGAGHKHRQREQGNQCVVSRLITILLCPIQLLGRDLSLQWLSVPLSVLFQEQNASGWINTNPEQTMSTEHIPFLLQCRGEGMKGVQSPQRTGTCCLRLLSHAQWFPGLGRLRKAESGRAFNVKYTECEFCLFSPSLQPFFNLSEWRWQISDTGRFPNLGREDF